MSIAESGNQNVPFNDWKETHECDQYTRCLLCNGYFIEPNYPKAYTDKRVNQTINIQANYSQINISDAIFIGKVKILQGQQSLYSEKLELKYTYEGKLDFILARDYVKIIQPRLRLDGKKGIVTFSNEIKTLYDASFRFYDRHCFGQAQKIKNINQKITHINHGTYSSCNPIYPSWQLQAKDITLDQNKGRGEAWHTWFYLYKTPVLYTPYISFPIYDKRKTGLLPPQIESSDYFGRALVLPVYWNIAPNMDVTISPSYTSKSSWRLFNEFRYITPSHQGIYLLDWLPHDTAFREFKNHKLSHPGALSSKSIQALELSNSLNRYALYVRQMGKFGQQTSYQLILARVSDANFIENIGDKIFKVKIPRGNLTPDSVTINLQQLPQFAKLLHSSSWGNIEIEFQRYQTLNAYDAPVPSITYHKLPHFSHSYTQWAGQFQFSTEEQATLFRSQNIANQTPLTTGNRYHVASTLSYRLSQHPGWYITPSLKIDFLYENLNRSPTDIFQSKYINRTIPITSVRSGLIFERNFVKKEQNYIHTLEPQAFFLYIPYYNQDAFPNFESSVMSLSYDTLFRDNRYSGFDRIAAAQQLSLGVSSYLYDIYGKELVKIQVAQAFYIKKRVSQLNENIHTNVKRSPIIIQAQYNFSPKFNTQVDWIYNEPNNKTDVALIKLQFFPSTYDVYNLSYVFQRNSAFDNTTNKDQHIKQVNFSVGTFLHAKWRLLFLNQYDLQNKHILKYGFGIDYFGCCTGFRLFSMAERKSLNPIDTGFRRKYNFQFGFQIALKGLTDIGTFKTPPFEIDSMKTPKDY